MYSITNPTTFLLYHARPYPIYHSQSLCIPPIRSQDIKRKRSRNHELPENTIPPYIVCGGIIRPTRPTAEIALSWWIKVEVSLNKQQLEYANDLFICWQMYGHDGEFLFNSSCNFVCIGAANVVFFIYNTTEKHTVHQSHNCQLHNWMNMSLSNWIHNTNMITFIICWGNTSGSFKLELQTVKCSWQLKTNSSRSLANDK